MESDESYVTEYIKHEGDGKIENLAEKVLKDLESDEEAFESDLSSTREMQAE